MRKLLAFVVVIVAIMSLMDRLHTPPNIADAAVTKSVAVVKPKPQKEAPATPVATPVATAPAAPTYTRLGGCEQYRSIVAKYDWNVRTFMAVMEAESYNAPLRISCDSQVVGDQFTINGVYAPSCGLMQVRTIAAWRGTCEQLKDPEYNISIAYRIYQGQGMAAWSAYTNGSYAKYLK